MKVQSFLLFRSCSCSFHFACGSALVTGLWPGMFCCCFFLSMEHVQFILFCFCSVRLYNRSENMQLSGVLVFLLHYLLSFWRENGNTRRRRYRRKLMWSIFAGVSFLNQYTVVYMPCVYVQFLPYYSMRFYCIPFHSSLPPSCPPVLAESHTQIPSFLMQMEKMLYLFMWLYNFIVIASGHYLWQTNWNTILINYWAEFYVLRLSIPWCHIARVLTWFFEVVVWFKAGGPRFLRPLMGGQANFKKKNVF